ncbi:MAG: hypothetical protein MZW92_08980 [Comamonadaceae bacterium]|nr:hypothetical protein [Comamonadaceae bacterium]
MPRSRPAHRLLHRQAYSHEPSNCKPPSTSPGKAAPRLDAVNAPEVRDAVEQVIAELNAGRLRVAERQGVGQWTVNQWVKKAVLLTLPPQRQPG